MRRRLFALLPPLPLLGTLLATLFAPQPAWASVEGAVHAAALAELEGRRRDAEQLYRVVLAVRPGEPTAAASTT